MTPDPLLTPAEALAYFGYRDRGALRRLAARGLVERVNVGDPGNPRGYRWRYRLKPLEAAVPPLDEAEVKYQELKRRHGW